MTHSEKLITIAENELKVYEAGKKEEYDRFWDVYQDNGNRRSYRNAFAGVGWGEDVFKPKYDIIATDCYMMFYQNDKITDLVTLLENAGVTFNVDDSTNCQYTFSLSTITRVGAINPSKLTTFYYTFERSYNLREIEKITFRKSQGFQKMFDNCTSLESVTFDGVIGQNGLNLQWSPLSHDSLVSLINTLEDKTGDTSGTTWKVTIGSTNYAKLTEEEIAMADAKGWTLD